MGWDKIRRNKKVSEQANGSELHFRTGVRGWLARLFVARRAAGDPGDTTVIAPCLIFLILVRLNDLGRVDVSVVIAGLLIPACLAGCWIGMCLGTRGQLRAMLRGFFVGALEGGASVVIVKEAVGQHEALTNTFNLMYLNFVCFWSFSMLASVPSDILTQTEDQWQIVLRRQKEILKVIRISLGAEELKGESTTTAIAVWIVKGLLQYRVWLGLFAMWAAWKYYAIDTWAFFKNRNITPG